MCTVICGVTRTKINALGVGEWEGNSMMAKKSAHRNLSVVLILALLMLGSYASGRKILPKGKEFFSVMLIPVINHDLKDIEFWDIKIFEGPGLIHKSSGT